jgi:GntR family transcriptional regulator
VTETGTGTGTGPTADQVQATLVVRVASGGLRPGQRLGSERHLASELGLTRTALRQALAALEDAGMIRRVPGRGGGTFVTEPKIERDLTRLVGLPTLLRAQGVTAGTRVLNTALVAANPSEAGALDLPAGDLIASLVRIRLANGAPISVEHARFPAARFPGLLELPLGGSVYELLETHYGTRPTEATERIEVVAATAEQATLLGVALAAPLLSITRTTTDPDGVPIEYSHDLFRGDRTRILVRTSGSGSITRAARTRGQIVELRALGGS